MSKYTEVAIKDDLHGLFESGRGVLTNFWNILEHPDFPFVTLTSTTNGPRNFPFYDIIDQPDGKARIELAAAGYTKDQLTVEKVGTSLIVKGTPVASKETRRYKSLYASAWQRVFELQPNAIVESVKFENGLLIVVVGSEQPAEKPRTTFKIE